MTLTFSFEGQGHILFSVVDYVGIHVKINLIRLLVCEIL